MGHASISDGFHWCVCVSLLSGGVIREDSAYSIAAVPTSAARCPRCRRHTAESADCLCPRCQTIVSQAHWRKVSPWQLANVTFRWFCLPALGGVTPESWISTSFYNLKDWEVQLTALAFYQLMQPAHRHVVQFVCFRRYCTSISLEQVVWKLKPTWAESAC